MEFIAHNREQARAIVKRFGDLWLEAEASGSSLVITIEPYRRPASNKQKTKLVLMLNDLAAETGHDAEAMRLWFRKKYLPPRVLKLNKTEIIEPKRIQDLTVEEASAAIEQVYSLAADHDVVLE